MTGNKDWPAVKRIEELQFLLRKELGLVRLKVNLLASSANDLKNICHRNNITYTEGIRRAIGVSYFLYKEARAGRVIRVVDKRGKVVKEVNLL